MKKLLTNITVLALVFSIGSADALAANANNTRGRNFIDADGDGICDYCDTYCEFVDADGDGICDNYGSGKCRTGRGRGRNFIDADGDGICDNAKKKTYSRQRKNNSSRRSVSRSSKNSKRSNNK